ncbi:MAG TPA: hypothetical protein VFE92_02450, partial [Dermatophilaceae bacterium]|nr:hypothetical protein [Dermatophilaceae bacterium]
LCGSPIPVLTGPAVHGARAEALELAHNGTAHGGGSAGDVDPGRVESFEFGAEGGRQDPIVRHKKEWTALCGGNWPGGKRIRKVGARCDRDSERLSRVLGLEGVLRNGDCSGVAVGASEALVGSAAGAFMMEAAPARISGSL